jgi:hypothetical protein
MIMIVYSLFLCAFSISQNDLSTNNLTRDEKMFQ